MESIQRKIKQELLLKRANRVLSWIMKMPIRIFLLRTMRFILLMEHVVVCQWGNKKWKNITNRDQGVLTLLLEKCLILDVIECHERKGDGVPTALRPEAKMTALPCYRILNMKSSVWIPYLHGILESGFETLDMLFE